MNTSKWKKDFIKVMRFLLNPRFLLCFGIAWFFTNGWSYVMMGLGLLFQIKWMIAVSGAYLTWLWLPISSEKLVTMALAIFILKRLSPDDQKPLADKHSIRDKVRDTMKKKKAEHEAAKKE